MPDEIQAGEKCIARCEVALEDGLAFEAGEPVLVERLEVDEARPGYCLVVFSERLGRFVHLSPLELARAGQPVVIARVPPSGPVRREESEPVEQAEPPVPESGGPPPVRTYRPPRATRHRQSMATFNLRITRPGTRRMIGAVTTVIIIAVIGITLFVYMGFRVPRPTPSGTEVTDEAYLCENNLRAIKGAVAAYTAQYGAFPPDGPVRNTLVPMFLKQSPTCPTSGSEYVLKADYPFSDCPTNEPDHILGF